ncbi:MAG TPA: hypothetical protein VGG79_06480 [Roseiarcus sp.]|jgi:hypothetical protein
MIKIAITLAAFEAIGRAMPVGSVAVEPQAADNGEREIWLAPHVINKLRAIRGPGESYSDVIIRLAVEDA